MKLTPLESRQKALSNEVYIDFGHMVTMSHAWSHDFILDARTSRNPVVRHT